jgi:hypothetical protein
MFDGKHDGPKGLPASVVDKSQDATAVPGRICGVSLPKSKQVSFANAGG